MKLPSAQAARSDRAGVGAKRGGLRWGILGTGRAAMGSWESISLTGHSRVVAVGSRDLERSRNFIAEGQGKNRCLEAPRAHGTYESVLTDPDVDAVYIPLPTALHREWVIRSAEAGRHVVCEKPCATSFEDLQAMVGACRKHKVQFMDGVAFAHDRRLALAERIMGDAAEFGVVNRITSSVGFNATNAFSPGDIRFQPKLEPHGSLGDMGWYTIRLSLWAMREKLPIAVSGRILSRRKMGTSPEACIAEFAGTLSYAGGVTAAFHCSFIGAPEQWAIITGTRSYIEMLDFLEASPDENGETTFTVRKGFLPSAPRVVRLAPSSPHPNRGAAVNLFHDFATQVGSGNLETEWPLRSLRTQIVLDACHQSALQDGTRITLNPNCIDTLP